MKLLWSTKNKITKDKTGENALHLETTKIVSAHCNIVSNGYQQDLRILFTFNHNKSFCQLLDISPKYFIFLKTFNSE